MRSKLVAQTTIFEGAYLQWQCSQNIPNCSADSIVNHYKSEHNTNKEMPLENAVGKCWYIYMFNH